MRSSLAPSLLFAGALLMCGSVAFGQDNATQGKWFKADKRWPTHVGPLIEEADPDAYLHRVISKESIRLKGWLGRYKSQALDTVTACGLSFDGYLRQRPTGVYLILVIASVDKSDHHLKWVPVEYRLDNGEPRYFLRRRGAPDSMAETKSHEREIEQQDYSSAPSPEERSLDPDASDSYLFDDEDVPEAGRSLHRSRGGAQIKARFKYLEVVKFAHPEQLASHEWLQIYLPWVDECSNKPLLQFQRDPHEELDWGFHMQDWVSAGKQFGLPSYYLRGAFLNWNHHGVLLESHLATIANTSVALGRASYGYGIWLGRDFTLVPEVGYRGVIGSGGLFSGYGAGLNLGAEIASTRNHSSGIRLMFETGCDFERHLSGSINGRNMRNALFDCKIGIGVGW